MKDRLLIVGGVLAPLTYAFAVILGGLLRPGYNHVTEHISELIAGGAPNKAILDPIFAVYNLLALAFAVGVLSLVRARPNDRSERVGTIAAVFLIAGAAIGLATLFFPQDPGGPPVTLTGTVHIVLGGLSSLVSMLSMLLLGIWLRQTGDRILARYSFVSLVVVFLSGAMAVISTASALGADGLLERVTIFAYLQWMLVVALMLPITGIGQPNRRIQRTPQGAAVDRPEASSRRR